MKNKIILKSFSNKIFSYMRKVKYLYCHHYGEEVGFVIVGSALNNCYVISSDCQMVPPNFLIMEKMEYYFRQTKMSALFESFKKYLSFW